MIFDSTSVANRLWRRSVREGLSSPEEAEPDQWFDDWQRDGVLIEDTFIWDNGTRR
ncbi:hypothetical protein ACVOMS_24970 [Bradyrhizobium guangxiense]